MRRIIAGGALLYLIATWPLLAGPDECLYQVEAHDESGRTVLGTVAYALDRPGLIAAPLHVLRQGGNRWRSLHLISAGERVDRESVHPLFPIEDVVLIDAERNLLVLRSPSLPGCGAGVGAPPGKGAMLTGLRERRGYRSRLFRSTLERSVTLPRGMVVMRVAIPDGSGAPAGFLFDDAGRLVGSILPSPPGADRFLIPAVGVPPELIATAEKSVGRPPETIRDAGVAAVSDTTSMLLATALVADRREPPETILAHLEAVVERTGEFAGLLLERGAVEFGLGDLESAIADFKAAVAADPDLHLAHYNLGISLGADGRYAEAAEAFRSARRLEPKDPRTLYHLAVSLAGANRSAEAVGPYTDLSRVDPALAADLKALIGL